MKGGSIWRGGDRLRNFFPLTYWETDGAMLVQLSIEGVFLIVSASSSVKGEASHQEKGWIGRVVDCRHKDWGECLECKIQRDKHTHVRTRKPILLNERCWSSFAMNTMCLGSFLYMHDTKHCKLPCNLHQEDTVGFIFSFELQRKKIVWEEIQFETKALLCMGMQNSVWIKHLFMDVFHMQLLLNKWNHDQTGKSK